MRNRPTAFLAIAAASALLLSACGGDDSSEDPPVAEVDAAEFPEGSTMARLAEAGTMTVGTKFDQPLFGLVGPDGTPVGFDVEIAKIIAGELGIAPDKIEWTETVSANRETFIEEERVDIVVATYTINDDRKQVIDFAGPYYLAGQSLMVRADDDSIKSEADLSGKIVCSAEGSTPAKNIEENFPDAELRTFSQYTDCLDPLRNGQVDVLTTDNVILAGYVAESPDDFKLAGEQFTEEPYGIGLKKDDTDFRNFINDTLEAAYEDGRWDAAWEATAGEVLDTPTPPAVDRY
ncbi:glutamate ABC transporter substrate-binding protein [Sanguibacter inulinus]|jgi:glutamate transport system substrate-binding protein|uniref:Glutamate ABC transporter substrate-binding protein n=1 Tax=Sanguibacter inulinus TaxID=60922 RepID=A0A853EX14_9MICO|nr:glutamate ABC transporter substrate-binding protein [Sanguibacter inulinus]MBF0723856.1 glutamate ABC transporter substrate-binding protein [Sanguibacter inulinus]NYS95001.1 glutamate ABC transporter substrate-binding protein [Sanguibacter inulinus]